VRVQQVRNFCFQWSWKLETSKGFRRSSKGEIVRLWMLGGEGVLPEQEPPDRGEVRVVDVRGGRTLVLYCPQVEPNPLVEFPVIPVITQLSDLLLVRSDASDNVDVGSQGPRHSVWGMQQDEYEANPGKHMGDRRTSRCLLRVDVGCCL
jgi:hypothetical protein